MSKAVMIQIRHVPVTVHRRLKYLAAEAGQSLSGYLLERMQAIAMRPTIEEIATRLERLAPVATRESAAEMVRAARSERDRERTPPAIGAAKG